jgi:hypothetical protein
MAYVGVVIGVEPTDCNEPKKASSLTSSNQSNNVLHAGNGNKNVC